LDQVRGVPAVDPVVVEYLLNPVQDLLRVVRIPGPYDPLYLSFEHPLSLLEGVYFNQRVRALNPERKLNIDFSQNNEGVSGSVERLQLLSVSDFFIGKV